MGKPLVAIVGRPNVGKSALFNRLIQRRLAIVEGEPGITRDRLYAECHWRGRTFVVVDTGGLDFEEEGMAQLVTLQAQYAIEEADLLLFVVDSRQGLTVQDEEIAQLLRHVQKPIILVANKVDHRELEHDIFEFYNLGLGDPFPIAAEAGRNIGDLLDKIIESLPGDLPEEEPADDRLKIAIVGKPNVGKSSLVNTLIGGDRVIVSDIPGTTRDAIDTPFRRHGKDYVLIDTAGMRRKGRIDDAVERYSVFRSLRAVERADVCLLMIDATTGVTEQDQRIAGFVHESGKGNIIVINKWDLVEKDSNTMVEYEREYRRQLAFLHYAPMIFISAKTGRRLPQMLDLVDYVHEQTNIRISTGKLNDLLHEAAAQVQPPMKKGVRLKLFYAVQAQVKPPTFILFVNNPDLFHFSYRRYLENRLREHYGFHGSPIVIKAKPRS
ncbi:MAG: ribosome biogenesis GTPase Der [Limnochordia bacterium]|jgi:GTP-binding protein